MRCEAHRVDLHLEHHEPERRVGQDGGRDVIQRERERFDELPAVVAVGADDVVLRAFAGVADGERITPVETAVQHKPLNNNPRWHQRAVGGHGCEGGRLRLQGDAQDSGGLDGREGAVRPEGDRPAPASREREGAAGLQHHTRRHQSLAE